MPIFTLKELLGRCRTEKINIENKTFSFEKSRFNKVSFAEPILFFSEQLSAEDINNWWDKKILKITQDSKVADETSIFFALPGRTRHGKEFIAEVLSKNTPLVVTDTFIKEAKVQIVVDNVADFFGEILSIFYGNNRLFRDKNNMLIAITGTDGKTTTSRLLAHMLLACLGNKVMNDDIAVKDNKSASDKITENNLSINSTRYNKNVATNVATIGTIGVCFNNSVSRHANYTTPPCEQLHRTIHDLTLKQVAYTISDKITENNLSINSTRYNKNVATNVATIGTIGVCFNNSVSRHANYTTPPCEQLHRTIHDLTLKQVAYTILETSSQALEQKRTAGLTFTAGIMTHIAQDHLDVHGSLEKYIEAKSLLFSSLPKSSFAVLRAKDKWCTYMAEKTKATCHYYSLIDDEKEIVELRKKYKENLWLAKIINIKGNKQKVWWQNNKGESYVSYLNMLGDYNVENALAALVTLVNLGFSFEIGVNSLADFAGVPGRMETLDCCLSPQDEVKIIVDFAHTPLALESLLKNVRKYSLVSKHKSPSRLFVLCNSTGDREIYKRPLMAKICEKYADFTVLTLEDIGLENPNKILEDIACGFSNKGNYICLPLRQVAIRYVMKLLKDGDVFVLPALGDQDRCNFGNKLYQYNDLDFVQTCIVEEQMRRYLQIYGLDDQEKLFTL